MDRKALLLTKTSIQLKGHVDVKDVATWKLHPYILMSLVWGDTLQATKKKHKHYKVFDQQSVLPANYACAMMARNLRE